MENDSCHSSTESENDCLDNVAELFIDGDSFEFDARESFDVGDNDASELERLKALSSTISV